jgi:hypothetical protein
MGRECRQGGREIVDGPRRAASDPTFDQAAAHPGHRTAAKRRCNALTARRRPSLRHEDVTPTADFLWDAQPVAASLR